MTLYLGLRYTWLFSKLAVMSPSVWWRNRAILKTVAKLPRKPELKIWLDIGTKESQRALPDAQELKVALVKKGWVEGRDLQYLEAPLTPSIPNPPGRSGPVQCSSSCSRRSNLLVSCHHDENFSVCVRTTFQIRQRSATVRKSSAVGAE